MADQETRSPGYGLCQLIVRDFETQQTAITLLRFDISDFQVVVSLNLVFSYVRGRTVSSELRRIRLSKFLCLLYEPCKPPQV